MNVDTKRLEAVRVALKLSKVALADRLGISKAMIYFIYEGKRKLGEKAEWKLRELESELRIVVAEEKGLYAVENGASEREAQYIKDASLAQQQAAEFKRKWSESQTHEKRLIQELRSIRDRINKILGE